MKPAALLTQLILAISTSIVHAQSVPVELKPDIPARGASLFDELYTRADGASRSYNIPFPLAALTAQMRGTQVNGALYPFGRSIQRPVGLDYQPFVYPRVVLSFINDSTTDQTPVERVWKGRIFIGYHEIKEQIEVISYNAELGRYEFQVIRDYAPGKIPSVTYASRALCLSCHQNGGPVFGRDPWQDSNLPLSTAHMIQKARKNFFNLPTVEDTYQGVKIELSGTSGGSPSGAGVQAVDEALKTATSYLMLQNLWRGACVSVRDPKTCRRSLFKMVVAQKMMGLNFVNRDGLFINLETEVLDSLQIRYGNSIAAPDPHVPNRDPFESLTPNLRGRLQQNPLDTSILEPLIRNSANSAFETAVANPASPRTQTFAIDDFSRVYHEIFWGITATATELKDWVQISQALKASDDLQVLMLIDNGIDGYDATYVTGSVVDPMNKLIAPLLAQQTRHFAVDSQGGSVKAPAFGGTINIAVPSGLQALSTFTPDTKHLPGIQCLLLAQGRTRPSFLCTNFNITRLMSTLDRMDSLDSELFDREVLFRDFWNQMGDRKRALYYPIQQHLEARDFAHIAEPSSEVTSTGPIRLFLQYCGTCHATDSFYPPGFLFGTTKQVQQQLIDYAPAIEWRLQTPDIANQMPPLRSDNHKELLLHPEDRAKLVEYIQQIRANK